MKNKKISKSAQFQNLIENRRNTDTIDTLGIHIHDSLPVWLCRDTAIRIDGDIQVFQAF